MECDFKKSHFENKSILWKYLKFFALLDWTKHLKVKHIFLFLIIFPPFILFLNKYWWVTCSWSPCSWIPDFEGINVPGLPVNESLFHPADPNGRAEGHVATLPWGTRQDLAEADLYCYLLTSWALLVQALLVPEGCNKSMGTQPWKQ